jgi:hypothetical protein
MPESSVTNAVSYTTPRDMIKAEELVTYILPAFSN